MVYVYNVYRVDIYPYLYSGGYAIYPTCSAFDPPTHHRICADIHLLVRSLFVIFPKSRRLEGYITNKLPNISRCIADIYTNWPWFIRYMLC